MSVSPFHYKDKYTGSQRGIELRKTREIDKPVHLIPTAHDEVLFTAVRVEERVPLDRLLEPDNTNAEVRQKTDDPATQMLWRFTTNTNKQHNSLPKNIKRITTKEYCV